MYGFPSKCIFIYFQFSCKFICKKKFYMSTILQILENWFYFWNFKLIYHEINLMARIQDGINYKIYSTIKIKFIFYSNSLLNRVFYLCFSEQVNINWEKGTNPHRSSKTICITGWRFKLTKLPTKLFFKWFASLT